jgi:hypothetical protein
VVLRNIASDLLALTHRRATRKASISSAFGLNYKVRTDRFSKNFFLPIFDKHSTLSKFGQFTSMGRPIMTRSEGANTSGGNWGLGFIPDLSVAAVNTGTLS